MFKGSQTSSQTGYQTNQTATTHVRSVALLPGETIDIIFSPQAGLTEHPSDNGQLLITTNQRVLAFCRNEGRNETYIAPVNDLQGVAVRERTRSSASVLQGVLLALGAIVLYLAVAYWITGRVEGPSIPIINMDVVPFLVLIVALAGVGLVAKHYFATEDGSVTFQGSNWNFAFPYKGKQAGQDLQQVVNSVFARRFYQNGHAFLWED